MIAKPFVMSPELSRNSVQQYYRIADAIHFYIEHQLDQPSLSDVAAHVSLSPAYFQRVFTAWAGVSPTHFLQFLTKESAKSRLPKETVQAAAYASGLSSQSRLHDLMLQWEGITPGDYRRAGAGLQIEYGCGSSPFGLCFIAFTPKGICKLVFLDGDADTEAALQTLQQDWPAAELSQNTQKARRLLEEAFAFWQPVNSTTDSPTERKGHVSPLRLLVKGTAFQLQVWQALLAIPPGYCWSYQSVAAYIGRPTATRAVASAIAANPVGYLIPCHRVIRQTGIINGYRWGLTRKALLLGWEASRR